MPIGIDCKHLWQEVQDRVAAGATGFGGRSERSGIKNREDRVVVLNGVAKRVIDAQSGLHREFAFVSNKGKPRNPIRYRNNTAWQNAREEAGLVQVRVHDLKHTFGRRLRTAAVPLETRKVLLGQKTRDITSDLPSDFRASSGIVQAANLGSDWILSHAS